jgi:HEAT repeat protein
MRLQKNADAREWLTRIPGALLLLLFMLPEPIHAGQPAIPENEMTAAANYDEVIRDLIAGFTRDKTTAQDSALKLARLGKRSVPVLVDILQANYAPEPSPSKDPKDPAPKTILKKGNPTLAYYATLALSRMRLADAAKPLLPILENPHSSQELRTLVIDSLGLENVPEGGVLLQKIAAGDPDISFRKKAYSQLSIMPNFWVTSEKLFVDALSDPDDEIRALAAKQCMFTRIYVSGIDKLIELSEKDSQATVRTNAMLALSRMKVRKAVPALVRVSTSAETPAALVIAAVRNLNIITGMSLKDGPAIQTWWQKFGEAEYAKLEAPPKAPEKVQPKEDVAAPEKKE